MSEKIICKINDIPNFKFRINDNPFILIKINDNDPGIHCRIKGDSDILVKIFDDPDIKIKFGNQGLRGRDGLNTDHALLSHLDYDNSGHTNFQKKLVYNPYFHCYVIES